MSGSPLLGRGGSRENRTQTVFKFLIVWAPSGSALAQHFEAAEKQHTQQEEKAKKGLHSLPMSSDLLGRGYTRRAEPSPTPTACSAPIRVGSRANTLLSLTCGNEPETPSPVVAIRGTLFHSHTAAVLPQHQPGPAHHNHSGGTLSIRLQNSFLAASRNAEMRMTSLAIAEYISGRLVGRETHILPATHGYPFVCLTAISPQLGKYVHSGYFIRMTGKTPKIFLWLCLQSQIDCSRPLNATHPHNPLPFIYAKKTFTWLNIVIQKQIVLPMPFLVSIGIKDYNLLPPPKVPEEKSTVLARSTPTRFSRKSF